jgi:hypothetical protein
VTVHRHLRGRWTTGGGSGNHAYVHLVPERRGRPAAGTVMASLALAGALLTACTSGPPPPPAPSVSGPPASSSTAEPSGPPPTASPPNSVTSSSTEPSSRSAPIGSAPPQVVRLGWLGRRPASSGVQIAVAGGTRWQGVVPGEYALLRGQGYQWFGADGSAVGCSAPGVCVGVDAAGYTAVLKGSVDRLVFYPDGRPLGRFDPEGRAVTGGALPAMSEAVAGTGVDMAALLDAASRPVPFAGGITGDPHVLTGAGRRYSTELTGQYHARYGDPDLAVQVRLEPVPHQPNVSVVTAVAVGAKSSVFEFSAQGAASLNRIVLPAPRPFKQVSIKDGPAVGLWATDKAGTAHAAMVWADGSSVVMSANPDLGMTFVVSAPPTPGVSGLFGVDGSDPAVDLQNRQGLASDPDAGARDWLVQPGEGLFSAQVDPTAGFPAGSATVPTGATAFADRACRAGGLTGAEDLAACEFDVGLTGDDGFVAGHAAMVRAATRRVPAEIAARWPALVIGPTESEVALPELVDVAVAAAEQRIYRMTVTSPGVARLEFVSGCPDREPAHPAPARPAIRLFDAGGRPVSDRLPTCGKPEIPNLQPGTYHLVIAGPVSGAAQGVRLQVRLP